VYKLRELGITQRNRRRLRRIGRHIENERRIVDDAFAYKRKKKREAFDVKIATLDSSITSLHPCIRTAWVPRAVRLDAGRCATCFKEDFEVADTHGRQVLAVRVE
jgi:hypothetical protein